MFGKNFENKNLLGAKFFANFDVNLYRKWTSMLYILYKL